MDKISCVIVLLLPLVAPQMADFKPLCDIPNFGKNVDSPNSCESYYFCDSFGPVQKVCPTGQWFDYDTDRCQIQSVVECNILFGVPIENGVTCPNTNDPNYLYYRPSKVACNRYYVCYMNRATVRQCTGGLWWNQATLECDSPMNVDCQIPGDEIIVDTTTVRPAHQFNCPATGVEFLPHPEHCNWFVYCRNGTSSIQQCQFLQHFDVVTKQCKFKFEATCANPEKSEKI